MKLTKAQRLFIKAGEQQAEINYWKWVDQGAFADDNGPDCSEPISIRKKLRKKYIREALEVHETEKLVQQSSAYERGFCAGRRIK